MWSGESKGWRVRGHRGLAEGPLGREIASEHALKLLRQVLTCLWDLAPSSEEFWAKSGWRDKGKGVVKPSPCSRRCLINSCSLRPEYLGGPPNLSQGFSTLSVKTRRN